MGHDTYLHGIPQAESSHWYRFTLNFNSSLARLAIVGPLPLDNKMNSRGGGRGSSWGLAEYWLGFAICHSCLQSKCFN